MSTVSGGCSCEVATSVICLHVSQLALRKFHRLTGLHAIGAARHGEEISDGRCCDRGNLSSTRRVGMPVSAVWANARSGLVSEFQPCEWKLAGSFGSYRRVRLFADAHAMSASPSALHMWCPHSLCWQLKYPAYIHWLPNDGNNVGVSLVGGGLYMLTIVIPSILIASHSISELECDRATVDQVVSCDTKVASCDTKVAMP